LGRRSTDFLRRPLAGNGETAAICVNFREKSHPGRVALDLAAGHQASPAGLFDALLEVIDAGEKALSGTSTRRAGTGRH